MLEHPEVCLIEGSNGYSLKLFFVTQAVNTSSFCKASGVGEAENG